jgi:hypothetical protein
MASSDAMRQTRSGRGNVLSPPLRQPPARGRPRAGGVLGQLAWGMQRATMSAPQQTRAALRGYFPGERVVPWGMGRHGVLSVERIYLILRSPGS